MSHTFHTPQLKKYKSDEYCTVCIWIYLWNNLSSGKCINLTLPPCAITRLDSCLDQPMDLGGIHEVIKYTPSPLPGSVFDLFFRNFFSKDKQQQSELMSAHQTSSLSHLTFYCLCFQPNTMMSTPLNPSVVVFWLWRSCCHGNEARQTPLMWQQYHWHLGNLPWTRVYVGPWCLMTWWAAIWMTGVGCSCVA